LRRWFAAGLLSLTLFACDLELPSRDDPPAETNAPEPADELEVALRELGRERAPYMILSEASMRDELDEGGARDYSQVLYPGWCYKVLGLGGEGVEDLDIRIYDPNDVLLQRDTTRDERPYIGRMRPICPVVPGTYRVQVRVVAGSGPYVVQVYRSI